MKTSFATVCGLTTALTGVSLDAHANSLTAADTAVMQDFNDFRGLGFAPTPAFGQLDSDHWRVRGLDQGDGQFGGTHTTGAFARYYHIGDDPASGIHAYGLGAGNAALGLQPTDNDLTPGDITYRIENNTGQALNRFSIQGLLYVFNNTDHASLLDVQWSTDDLSYTSITPGGPTLVTDGAAEHNTQWRLGTAFDATFLTGDVADGDSIYFRFVTDDAPGEGLGGERDQLAIDDLAVTGGRYEPADVISTPSPTALIGGLVGLLGFATRRRRKA